MNGGHAAAVIRAVVLDVDGTVLRSDHTIAPETRKAVAEVVGLGVPVILASSRSPRGLAPVQAALGIVGQYLVAFQGALTGRLTGPDADGFEMLDELPMEVSQASTIALMATAEAYGVNWYTGMEWYVDRVDDRARREARITGESPRVADLLRLTAGPHKILCIGPDGTSPARLQQLAARMPAGAVAHSQPTVPEGLIGSVPADHDEPVDQVSRGIGVSKVPSLISTWTGVPRPSTRVHCTYPPDKRSKDPVDSQGSPPADAQVRNFGRASFGPAAMLDPTVAAHVGRSGRHRRAG